jgi:hypothetical protein
MKDKFIFTDVHGCGGELEALLKENADCDIISLGDNFDRAFDGVRVWELIKEYNVTCILGNHELKILQYLTGRKSWLPKHYYQFLNEFAKKYDIAELVNSIERMPWLITDIIGGKDFIFTHGGINLESPRIPNLSCNVYGNFDPNLPKPQTAGKDDDWWNFYDGNDIVVYGHISDKEPRLRTNPDLVVNSIGLDTAACTGNCLTGMRINSENGDVTFSKIRSRNYFSIMRTMDIEVFQP